MLCLDPEKRITAKEMLQHEYFAEVPPPKAHHLMPTWPSTHAGKGAAKALLDTYETEGGTVLGRPEDVPDDCKEARAERGAQNDGGWG